MRSNWQKRLKSAPILSWTLLLTALLLGSQARAYEYPYSNPYLATVAGTPPQLMGEIPDIKIKKRRLQLANGRKIPPLLSFGRKLEYSIATQRGPAPLIFAIAGTGGYHNSSTNLALLKAFYGAGFHVVGISSPTHPKFQISASSTGVPGNMAVDAEDLYQIMTRIRERHGQQMQVTGYHLTGYSLGGMQAAFVAKLDETEQRFNFDRVLLINSPVSLYSSVSKLDRMLENVPGGIDNFDRYFNGVVRQISEAYTRSTSVEFNQDLVYAAFQANPPKREDLAAVIGTAFRLAAMNMIFTADVISNFGFIKPKEMQLPSNADLDPFLQVALRVGLTDYFHEFIWPYYQPRYPNMTREGFANAQSLRAMADYLRAAEHIFVVHNEDDVILAGNEIEFFRSTFGNRAKIYPHGGHLGNIVQRETLGHIVATMADAKRAANTVTTTTASAR